MSIVEEVISNWRQRFLPLGYFLGSGILMGVGFIWPALWVLVFLGIVSFVVGIRQVTSLRRVLLYGFLAWTVKVSFAMFWMLSIYPILWVDMGLGKAELPVIIFYWITISMFLGLAGAIASGVLWTINRQLNPLWFLLAGPLVWVISEILGSYLFSIFTQGEYIKINKVFSFGYVGYLLAEHEWLIQIARWGGVYLLTVVIVFLAMLLWWYLSKLKFSQLSLQITLLILVILSVSSHIGFGRTSSETERGEITVAIIDTKFGEEEYFNLPDPEQYRVEKIIEALASAQEENPNYILMSEDSRYLGPDFSPTQAYARFRFQQGDPAAVVVETGPATLSGGGKVVRAHIYDGVGKKVYVADKQSLVPQGEYMPSLYIRVLSLFGLSKEAEFVDGLLAYRPGPMVSQAEFPSHIPGVLFCFNSADPFGVRKLLEGREVPFIAHPISYAWFHNPVSMRHQYDSMLKIHAIWNQVPIISAGNMVNGVMYTPQGEIVGSRVVTEGEGWQVSLVSL